ncbi:MAG: peptidoglycan-binding protein [Christensenellales bacterium]|jgi:hypothetical protein
MFTYVKDLKLQPKRAYIKRKITNAIVIHHFASNATPEQVHASHIKKGNKGIDYNIVILLDGTAVWGRGLEYEGGHTRTKYGYNARSIGIACQGNFEVNKMSDGQKAMLMRVITDCLKYYPAIHEITPHLDVSPTLCPGKFFPLEETQQLLYIDNPPSEPDPSPEPPAFTLTRLLRLNYIVNVGVLNMRTGPSVLYPAIRKLKRADVLTLISRSSKWAKVLINGTQGHVYLPYIRRAEMMRGTDVSRVQRALSTAGFYPGAIDGIFGPNTLSAVVDFQRENALAVDGIVGPQTTRALGGTWV